MNAEEARSVINLWNSQPPQDPIEREARFAIMNQAVGYLRALEGPEVKALIDSLEEIKLGRGPYKKDHLEHAASCIEAMKEEATKALVAYMEAINLKP